MSGVLAIHLSQDGNLARLRPANRLGEKAWDEFVQATAGGYYDRDRKVRVAPLDKIPGILVRLRNAGFDAHLEPMLRSTLGKTTAQQWQDYQNAKDRLAAIDREIFERHQERLFPYQYTGAVWLTLRQGGAALFDEMGLGKALPISEPILTPYGWVPIGRIEEGELVIGSTGKPVRVTGVFPQAERIICRIVLEDGRSVRCDREHLWTVLVDGEKKTLTYEEILAIFMGDPKLHDYWWNGYARAYHVPEAQRDRVKVPVFTRRPEPENVRHVAIRSLEIVPAEESSLALREECICIRVDAPDSLFVTTDYVLTHNTRSILVSIPPGAPVLVICPASVKSVWYGETTKLRPNMHPRVIEGRANFRFPKPGEMLIANFELLPDCHDRKGEHTGRACEGDLPPDPCPGCKDELVRGPDGPRFTRTGHLPRCNGFLESHRCPGCHPRLDEIAPGTVVVVDEAQFGKSSSAERSLRTCAICGSVRKKNGKTIVSTGTPLENNPLELWNVLQLGGLGTEAFGNFGTFAEICKGSKNVGREGKSYGYSWEDDPDDAIVERLRRVSLRRTKADVQKDLPPKLYQDRIVPIDKKAIAESDAFLRKVGGVEAIERLLETEIRFETMSAILTALSAAKVGALLKIVEDEYEARGEPVVVFAMHRAPIELLGMKKGWATILGGDNQDRGKVVADFQAGKYKGLAATIKAAGTGLTLTRADTVLFLSKSFNPKVNEQAEDRIHRIGQKRTANIVSLVGDHPLDRRIAEITAKKTRMFNASVNAASLVDESAIDARDRDAEFAAYLRRIEDEVKGKPLPRTFPTEEQEALVERLRTATFELRSDGRIAAELVEEALTAGLSEPRWRLAARVAERALSTQPSADNDETEIEKAPVEGLQLAADGLMIVGEDPHLVECARTKDSASPCSCGSVPDRADGLKADGLKADRLKADQLTSSNEPPASEKRISSLERVTVAHEDLPMSDDKPNGTAGQVSDRMSRHLRRKEQRREREAKLDQARDLLAEIPPGDQISLFLEEIEEWEDEDREEFFSLLDEEYEPNGADRVDGDEGEDEDDEDEEDKDEKEAAP